jgi:hypothetical protein
MSLFVELRTHITAVPFLTWTKQLFPITPVLPKQDKSSKSALSEDFCLETDFYESF